MLPPVGQRSFFVPETPERHTCAITGGGCGANTRACQRTCPGRCFLSENIGEVYGEILPSGFAVSEINHIENAFEA